MPDSLRRPLLLGHRGARHHAPENTLAAFDLALQHGCDGFEFDVRLTRDHRAVICHDLLYRGLSVEKSVYRELSRRGERSLAGAPAQSPSLVPCLDDVVKAYCARAYLDIELKVSGLEKATVQTLAQHKPPAERFVVTSFFPEILRELRSRSPRVPIGFITDNRKHIAAWEKLDAELRLQVVAAHHKLVTGALLDEVHAAGKQLFVWTVNRERQMLQLADMGVDALISDDTELLGRVFRRHQ
jgi:glycerophosphoryl diester phosphodiesterase